jgi:uncharacterized SAM-binding protein YcdF (DUF218 family)
MFRVLGFGVIAVLGLAAFTPLSNFLARATAVLPALAPADAIVVLGGGSPGPDGVLSRHSFYRASYGIALYRRGLAPLLVLSGGLPQDTPPEGELLAELARRLGVPADAIVADSSTRTTREEAVRMKELLQPRGIRRILLVTNAQHLGRAKPLFERHGFDVLPAPATDEDGRPTEPGSRLDLLRQTLGEVLARLYYWIAGYI